MIDKLKHKSWSFWVLIIYVTIALLGAVFNVDYWAQQTDISNIYLAPFQSFSHILGTDSLGRNTLIGILNGVRISFLVGLFSALGSLFVAAGLGYASGYLGDKLVRISWVNTVTILILTFLLFFLWVYGNQPIFYLFLYVSTIFILHKYIEPRLGNLKSIPIPFDSIVMKIIGIFKSVPGMFLTIFLFSLFSQRSMVNLIIVIVIFRWPQLTRIIRSEIMKLKNQPFIVSAEASGLNQFTLLKNHLLPNIIEPVLVSLIYGFIASILIEASLTFIGLGLPLETVSWGSMLSGSRLYLPAWWLILFPGLIMFLIITALKDISNKKLFTFEY